MIKDIFLNSYELYTRPPKSRLRLGLLALAFGLAFAIGATFELCLSGSKLFFCVATLAVIQNFYFCVEKEVNVDESRHGLTWPNVCFILLVFFHFYLRSPMVFFLAINVLFYIRLIKSWTRPEARISILKNLAALLLALPAFAVCSDLSKLLVTLLGIPLSFAAWIFQVSKYERFTFLNHYLLFNVVFTVPLAFALDELPTTTATSSQVLLTMAVVILGSIALHLSLKFVIQTEMSHVLLIVNEFSVLLIAFRSGSLLVFAAFLALTVLTFRLVDFGFTEGPSEPLLESLGPSEFKSVEFHTEKARDSVEMEERKPSAALNATH